ncbi:hypothetical protein [Priestia endophytica]|uniref:hypothetical protein n=1 Tax=Priestia endophytica TaxID=135735 RepID=UPI00203DFA54|nr:hypothetical protein [Priestia endophytica]MCM3537931.1 hypothetical protein [Priestia endophytica]
MLIAWIFVIILILAVLFMPKRLTFRENMIVFFSVGYFAWIAHLSTGLMADLYDLGSTKKVEFDDWLMVTLVPSLISIVYLNFKKRDYGFLYIVIWTILSTLGEFTLVQLEYMRYQGWKLWYSIPVYLLAYLILPWYLNSIIRKVNDK